MWELDHKEDWMLENWCFQTVVLEGTFESPLDSKEIKPVNPKGNQPWIFIGRTDAEAEASILWPPDVKSQLIGKNPVADWGQEDKGVTEDEMVRLYHRFNGHEFEQTPGHTEGQGRLVCWCAALGVAKSQTQLSDWITTTNRCSLHLCPGPELLRLLEFQGSYAAQLIKNSPAMQETWVGKISWRREKLPTPVFWPGEFHGLYSPQGRKELDKT